MLYNVSSFNVVKSAARRKHVSTGYYNGPVKAEWRRDGRRMTVVADVAFVSSDGSEWAVPKGAVIDGASIPRLLWPIVGSPYTGLYRDASVIHDYYCSVRSRPSRDVHAMFHEAMLVSGVTLRQARLMYLAVVYAGPSWTDMDVANVKVAILTSIGFSDGGSTEVVLQANSQYRLAPGIVPEGQQQLNIESGTKALMLRWAIWTRRASARPTVPILLKRAIDRSSVDHFRSLAQVIADQDLDLEQINELVQADDILPDASLAW